MKWVFLIAAGVLLGIFAYEKYTSYRAQPTIQEMAESLNQGLFAQQKRNDESNQRAELQRMKLEAKKASRDTCEKQQKLDKSSACDMNEDKQICVCINKDTGWKVAAQK